jgi:hypothetical protein
MCDVSGRQSQNPSEDDYEDIYKRVRALLSDSVQTFTDYVFRTPDSDTTYRALVNPIHELFRDLVKEHPALMSRDSILPGSTADTLAIIKDHPCVENAFSAIKKLFLWLKPTDSFRRQKELTVGELCERLLYLRTHKINQSACCVIETVGPTFEQIQRTFEPMMDEFNADGWETYRKECLDICNAVQQTLQTCCGMQQRQRLLQNLRSLLRILEKGKEEIRSLLPEIHELLGTFVVHDHLEVHMQQLLCVKQLACLKRELDTVHSPNEDTQHIVRAIMKMCTEMQNNHFASDAINNELDRIHAMCAQVCKEGRTHDLCKISSSIQLLGITLLETICPKDKSCVAETERPGAPGGALYWDPCEDDAPKTPC